MSITHDAYGFQTGVWDRTHQTHNSELVKLELQMIEVRAIIEGLRDAIKGREKQLQKITDRWTSLKKGGAQ